MAAALSQDETTRGPDATLQALIRLSRDLSGTLWPPDILEELICKNLAIAQRVVFSTGDSLRGDTLKTTSPVA